MRDGLEILHVILVGPIATHNQRRNSGGCDKPSQALGPTRRDDTLNITKKKRVDREESNNTDVSPWLNRRAA